MRWFREKCVSVFCEASTAFGDVAALFLAFGCYAVIKSPASSSLTHRLILSARVFRKQASPPCHSCATRLASDSVIHV